MRCVRAVALGGVLFGLPLPCVAAGDPVLLHDTFVFDDVQRNRNRLLTSPRVQIADPFDVSGGDHVLEALEIGFFSAGPVNIVVRLWDDAGNVPGSVLESWMFPGPLVQPHCNPLPCGYDIVFQSVEQPTLFDGERLWISVAADGASWRKADLNALTTNPGPLVSNDILFATTLGEPTQWSVVPPEQLDTNGDGEPDLFLAGAFFGVAAVTAIPAPEPALLLSNACALGLAAALARRRRRPRALAPS